MNTYNFPSLGVVAFVVLVFVGVGVLGYYAYDITTRYDEMRNDLAALREEVAAVKNENETLKRVNADAINRANGLEAENNALRNENLTLTAQLQTCQLQNSFAPAGTVNSTILPSDPRAAIMLVLLLTAAILAGGFSFSYWRKNHSASPNTYHDYRGHRTPGRGYAR